MGRGGGARSQAALNHANASAVSEGPPSATKPCPYMKPLRLGVFFDGTNNNKYRDRASGKETNVVRLFDVYKDTSDAEKVRDKLYLIGVGAGSPEGTADRWSHLQSSVGTSSVLGGAFGRGVTDRLNIAYRWVKEKVMGHSDAFTHEAEKLIDIYGFSRGAMEARTFNNLVNQALKTETPREKFQNIQVRFLGVFDTVDSTVNVEVNMGLASTDFLGCRHCTARDEIREHFPLTLLGTNDIEYAGVHSDVGGGYAMGDQGKRNWLAGPPLWDMYQASRTQTVEFTRDPTLPGGMSLAQVATVKHDSDLYDGTSADKTTHASTAWRTLYVHKSDSDSIGMGARMVVPDHDVQYNWLGRPKATEAKREVVRVRKFRLKSRPPNFSWNS